MMLKVKKFFDWVYGVYPGAAPAWVAAVVTVHLVMGAVFTGAMFVAVLRWWSIPVAAVLSAAVVAREYQKRDRE